MSHKFSICEKNFKSISASIQHRLAAHASSTCKLCNKCFKNTTSLAQHTQMAHAKPKPIEEEDGYDLRKRDREDMEDARAIYEEWYNPDGGNEDYADGDD